MGTYFYQPAFETKEAALKAREFMKDHKDVFWQVLKPVLPFIIGGRLLDIFLIHLIWGAGSQNEIFIGSLISAYFTFVMMINWHRVVLHGPDQYIPMNPFQPKKSELAFMLMPSIVGLVAGIGIGLLSALTAKILGEGVAVMVAVPLVIVLLYVLFKMVFYLPAKALGADVGLRQALSLSDGYVWKCIGAGFRAVIRVTLVTMAYGFVGVFIIGIIMVATGTIGPNGTGVGLEDKLIAFLVMLPITAYFMPLSTLLGVTVVSNYYQHAMQNRGYKKVPDTGTM